MKKHQAVVAEINNHESRLAAVTQAGQQMVDANHFASEDIKQRLVNLNKHWNHLKEKALQVLFLFCLIYLPFSIRKSKLFTYNMRILSLGYIQ